ncbi:selenoneine biosynthesis selenosugar synthase SenB [Roseateles puraquae]|uniref:selenoneine biosynthesis selenosugar synthase SenB n=1 Tax=Roseateles puraquae TaxID=431059 RepID=UPI0031D004A9
MLRPSVCIVSPARRADNNGNWHTAERWLAHLAPVADVMVVPEWTGQAVDVLIALHARRSAASIERFHEARPGRPIILVLTGTDVYRDIDVDPAAQRSLQLAHRLVGLQPRIAERLDAHLRDKVRIVVQGAEPMHRPHVAAPARFVAVGHLRAEKDPLTLMRAVRRLPPGAEVLHVGGALDESLAAEARALMADFPNYRWAGAVPHDEARAHIATATALVHMSRLEGGANVVIEAIVSGTPVLASRIDGNVGLLGEGYGGYFPAGDDKALAALMTHCMTEPHYLAGLVAQCAPLAAGYTLGAERERVQALLADCLEVGHIARPVTGQTST